VLTFAPLALTLEVTPVDGRRAFELGEFDFQGIYERLEG
jgi:hypothetical protein